MEYLITDSGREVFQAERKRISELTENAKKMDETL